MEKLQHCLRWKRSPDLAENAGPGVFLRRYTGPYLQEISRNFRNTSLSIKKK